MGEKLPIYGFDEELIKDENLFPNGSSQTLYDLKAIRRKIDKAQQRDTSDKNSGAQYTRLYDPQLLQELQKKLSGILSGKNSLVGEYEKAVIELQFLYGLRISEVLNIHYSDILPNGSIRIKGLKNSNNRIVFPIQMRSFWFRFLMSESIPPRSYNRFYFYRLYKKLGLYQLSSSNQNASVTHMLRYTYIAQLLEAGETIDSIRQLIGHKNINSTIHYLKTITNGNKKTI